MSAPIFMQVTRKPKPIVPGILRRIADGEPVILKRVGDAWTARPETLAGVGRTPEEALDNLRVLRGQPTADEAWLREMKIGEPKR